MKKWTETKRNKFKINELDNVSKKYTKNIEYSS